MPVIRSPVKPTHHMHGSAFTSLATPSLGSSELCVWRVVVPVNNMGTPHQLTREEVLVVLAGRALVRLDGIEQVAEAGDAIVVPPNSLFKLTNDGDVPLELLCCLPVGGKAHIGLGDAFVPPWAQ
jgi:mannose-6-phosphate isomerase-like protein (cupin superfamily)